MADPRSREVVEVAERHADGLATDEELAAAVAAAVAAQADWLREHATPNFPPADAIF